MFLRLITWLKSNAASAAALGGFGSTEGRMKFDWEGCRLCVCVAFVGIECRIARETKPTNANKASHCFGMFQWKKKIATHLR